MRNGYRHRVVSLITYPVSAALLYYALRDANLSQLGRDLVSMNWAWVAVAVAAGVGGNLAETVRWQWIFRPVAKLDYWSSVRAVFAGLLGNEVFSLHIGGVLRSYMLSRNKDLPFPVSFAGSAIGRVLEGFWWLLAMLLVMHTVPLPPDFAFLKTLMNRLAIVVIASNVVLGVVLFRGDKRIAESKTHDVNKIPVSPVSGWRRHLWILITDLRLICRSRFFGYAFLLSLPLMLIPALPIWAAFSAYGWNLSLGTAIPLMLLLRIGSSFPQAPGNLGIFQFLTRVCLEKVFHVAAAEAARFSLVLWGIVALPAIVGGFVALAIEGLSLRELRDAAKACALWGDPGDAPEDVPADVVRRAEQ
jgi:uncharacterized protein (TIRG00374 family)